MNNHYKNVYENFLYMCQIHMKVKHISQYALANMTGISSSAINRYFNRERTMTAINMLKIADKLGVDINTLLMWEE